MEGGYYYNQESNYFTFTCALICRSGFSSRNDVCTIRCGPGQHDGLLDGRFFAMRRWFDSTVFSVPRILERDELSIRTAKERIQAL